MEQKLSPDSAVTRPDDVPMLRASSISKHFDGVFAVRSADLTLRRGEIHALLGENGAGKSTLVKILTGVYAPDGGTVELDGTPVVFRDVIEAQRAGVVALYQELSIVPNLSVAENIMMGEKTPARAGFVDWGRLFSIAGSHLEVLNQRIPLRRLAQDLSPVQQTMVAVARALAVNARVLILDEPTASLTNLEIVDLFRTLRHLRDEGVAIVYVSHRLEEVFELCDRATIMRNGQVVAAEAVADLTIDLVISKMVGRHSDEIFPPRSRHDDEVIVEVTGLTGRRVRDVSLEVRRGEILGVGGLGGSGRSELLRLISGAQRAQAGVVKLSGKDVTPSSITHGLDAGIAMVPEERRSQGVILEQPIRENMILANLPSVSSAGLVRDARVRSLANRGMTDLQIHARGTGQKVGELSGGNQQKVVLAKFLARNPTFLLLDEPTRGIDVGTKSEIYVLIQRLAEAGAAVLVVSSELPELLGLCHRILLLHEGRLAGEVAAEHATEEQLLTYCYGRTA
ncbi:MAG: sugar ABC transporter ATP-binding protein [Propionibacteriaceae bacterium]|nr:sugar ABC transporter ATP-binding protein [Propionibacteriaceae bacterium]